MRIAPLTRREYKLAVDFRDHVRAQDPRLPHVSFQTRARYDELLEALNLAITEYQQRPLWRRRLPGPPGRHDRRIHEVFRDFAAWAEQQLAELDDAR